MNRMVLGSLIGLSVSLALLMALMLVSIVDDSREMARYQPTATPTLADAPPIWGTPWPTEAFDNGGKPIPTAEIITPPTGMFSVTVIAEVQR